MDLAERAELERSIRHAVRTHGGSALDSALQEVGWREALVSDPKEAVSILFELQGFDLSSSSGLEHVLADAMHLEVAATAGIVLPQLGRSGPPGDLKDGHLVIRGVGVASIAAGDTALVTVRSGDTDFMAPVPLSDLTICPVRGIDPDLGLVEVIGIVTEASVQSSAAQVLWPAGLTAAQLALGHELVGAARKMLELARTHALDRVQFGQPISAFQAVRHRLADTLVAIESADAVLHAAWGETSPMVAGVAKALAGRAARVASRHCQQVLAGVGFTTEHEFHRYVRRVFVLDQLFGSSQALTREFGNDLLATGRLPEFAPL